MYLRIAALGERAENLSYLLRKHPDRLFQRQSGTARIYAFFDAYRERYASATLLVLPDPLDFIRTAPRSSGIETYASVQQFLLSELFCSYLRDAYRSALAGDSGTLEVDAAMPLQLEIEGALIATDMPLEEIEMLWIPLGYEVTIETYTREGGEQPAGSALHSQLCMLHLRGLQTVQDALKHLMILLPTLDCYGYNTHGESESEQLLAYGADWLASHPLHKLIERRLARYRAVAMQAHYEPLLTHLSWLEQVDERELALSERTDEQESDVLQLMAALRPHCIVEFGCGSGSLTSKLAQLPWQPAVTGCDPSYSAIQIARQRAGKDGGATMVFLQSALPYYDPRLRNQEPTMKQVFILCDVLEHLNPGSIAAATELIFAVYRPDYVIVTMPNHEYSRNWPNMARRMVGGRRFEWTRAEFERWVESVVQERRYRYRTGEMDEATPAPDGPWQMVLFVAGDAKYGNSAHDAT